MLGTDRPHSARHLAIAWSGVLVFDSAVFGLTAYRTMRIGQGRLTTILLRDGECILALADLVLTRKYDRRAIFCVGTLRQTTMLNF